MRLLWCFVLIPLLTSGQHAVVRGVAPLAIGQEIQLRINDDPISGKERILAKQKVEADGSFELKVIANETHYAFLQVGQNCADFFIERDKDLELTFVPPRLDPNKPQAFYERHFFAPKILGGKSAKLNEQIISFNDTLDAFLEALYPALVNRKSPDIIAKELVNFEKQMAKDHVNSSAFTKEYIKYSIASVEQTFLSKRERLFSKYLKDAPPHFNNPAYTDFVLQFYQGAIYKMAVVNRYDECKKAFDQKEAFAKIEQLLMESEPQLTDVSVRRMVLIEGIGGLFGQRDFEDAKLAKALKDFGMLSSNSYLAKAAINIAAKYERLVKNAPAPEITFTDLNGTEKKLSDFQGAYVFLELTDATNAYCQRETNVVANLKDEFKNIRFVTVCIGNTSTEIQSLKKQMNITWELGSISIPEQVIEDYEIKSLPLFYVIDPEGRFHLAPAKDPSKGAQSELMALTEMIKAKSKRSVGK